MRSMRSYEEDLVDVMFVIFAVCLGFVVMYEEIFFDNFRVQIIFNI